MMTRSRALQILHALRENTEAKQEAERDVHVQTALQEKIEALRIAIRAVERETEVKKPLRDQR